DVTRLTQIVGNLLHNAGKFTDSGGSVRIALWAPPDRKHAVLVVEDTGVGMGLGLSLVKGLVVQHGGSVRAESEGAGRGSRFVVELPLEPDAPEVKPAARAAPGPETMTPGRRILVIEDSEDAAFTLTRLLT